MKTSKLLLTLVASLVLAAGVAFAADAPKPACCEKAAKEGKECTHECCVAAAKDHKTCDVCAAKHEEKKK